MRILFFLKISFMIFALVGVFYVMKYLNSQDFIAKSKSPNSVMGMLFGTAAESQNFQWCPEGVQKMILLSEAGREQIDVEWLKTTCSVSIVAADKADAEVADYQTLARAFAGARMVELERNSKSVYRVMGMTFRSDVLDKTFK